MNTDELRLAVVFSRVFHQPLRMVFEFSRHFVQALDQAGELKRVAQPVVTGLKITEIDGRQMKSPGNVKLRTIRRLAFWCCLFVLSGNLIHPSEAGEESATNTFERSKAFAPPTEGSRKENKDGDVHVRYDRDSGKGFGSGFELSIVGGVRETPKLRLHGLYFVDAKLDASRTRLAVVQIDGLNLIYGCYLLTNNTWQLDKQTVLVEYNVAFQVSCNRLELENFNTMRACFIKTSDRRSRLKDLEQGVEKPGDMVYLFRITEDGKVLVNGKERDSVQWYPSLHDDKPAFSTNAP